LKIAINSAIAVNDFSPPDSGSSDRLPGGEKNHLNTALAILVSSVSFISA
jgi:hypothetical protein